MSRFTSFFVLGALTLSACSEHDLSALQDPNEGLGPEILVEPTLIDFGDLGASDSVVESFTVTNVGASDLEVDSIDLVGDAGFVILTEATSFTLPPEGSWTIDVEFSPMMTGDVSAQALVNSNDPVNAQVPVDLLGGGLTAQLVIEPDPYDFGTHYVGCWETTNLTLRNAGGEDLTVTDIQYSDTEAMLDMTSMPALPFTLAPGATQQVTVDFDAWTAASATGTLSVTSNDPRGVVTGTQTGTAEHALTYTDNFQMPNELPVDIMFAIDQSCSMDSILTNLQSNFSTFISTIDGVTQDWRIGVQSISGGCFLADTNNDNANDLTPRYLTRSTPNYTTVFNNSVYTGTDGGGSWSERLFGLAQDGLGQMSTGCNAGFMRTGALLHIVFVSDEREQTSTSYATNASNFVSYAQSVKGNASLVKVSGIICPSTGCPSGGTYDGTNQGYLDAVNLTGGEVLDITASDWGTQVERLATASLVALGRFELSQTADEPSITVTVDGTQWTTGWYYDPATNSIVFTTMPAEGANIVVDYGVSIACN